jgi:ferredoxin--NADP+ reductase
MFSIAIIGSGPAGCYVAEHLLKLLPNARIDVLEKLPVPFGLIRYGVAPDHQSTKGAARVLDRTLSRDRVRFFGNVEVGRDVTLRELREMYHVVVLATGAPRDRKLGIPGEDLANVIGSGAFVAWYNGHPSRTIPELRDVRAAVIIGNGNVALDVARILAKHGDELKGSDLPPDVLAALRSQPIEEIHIVGRRSAAEAKFSPGELKEIGTLQRAKPVVADPNAISGDTPVAQVLREFAADDRTGLPVTIHFHFGLAPLAFADGEESSRIEVREGKEETSGLPARTARLLKSSVDGISGTKTPTYFQPPEPWPEGQLYPNSRLESVLFRSASGEEVSIPAQLAITCIGYEAVPCCTATPANGIFANLGGTIDDGLYVVGWAKRGPSGTIPTNRAEALEVAQKIASEITAAHERSAPDLTAVLQSRGVAWTDYAGWKRIEEAERAGACDERCRLKLLRAEEMIRIARQTDLELKGN